VLPDVLANLGMGSLADLRTVVNGYEASFPHLRRNSCGGCSVALGSWILNIGVGMFEDESFFSTDLRDNGWVACSYIVVGHPWYNHLVRGFLEFSWHGLH